LIVDRHLHHSHEVGQLLGDAPELHGSRADLATLKALIESGQLVPAVDRIYPLEETPEAIRELGIGKVGVSS
jgi:hypothetical protein